MQKIRMFVGVFVALVLVASTVSAGPNPPVPEPASTALLLGMSAFGLAFVRKFGRK